MKIGTHGEIEEVSFWPAEELNAAFKRVNAALGTPDELQEMRHCRAEPSCKIRPCVLN